MSDVDVRIQGIEGTLNKLLELADRHEPRGKHRSAKSRSRSQSPWKTIRSIVDKLAQDFQYVKEMVEGSGMKTGHDRSTGADDQNATLEYPLQILDQPPHEGQQTGQNSCRRHSERWTNFCRFQHENRPSRSYQRRKLREIEAHTLVVVVWGDIYHQGGTVGPATAEAVKYGGPGWSIEGYSECSPNCDGYPIPNAFLEFRAPNEPQREQGNEVSQAVHGSDQPQRRERLPRNRLPAPIGDGKATGSELRMNKQQVRPQKRRRDEPIPQHSRKKTIMHRSVDTIMTATEISNDLVSRMVTAVQSRDAIQQFFDIVHGRREPEPTAIRINFTSNASERQLRVQDPAQMLENDVKFIRMLSRKTAFHNFLTRLFQVRLADHIDEINQGRLRSDPAVIAKILKRTGMNRRQCQYHRTQGAKWREYCMAFPAFLPHLGLNLDEGDFASLLSHLKTEYMSALCVAGRAFEHSLDPAADDVDFIWANLSV
ncbi:hypothetical protein LTR96_011295 [Exophiala xenobiotica]|nr:hypothetical protein LTR92_011364 [Exophiala xenobiotica]KAK5263277.1 hypothetical protein LTR96_011295 [Exophiala xenobiotica]KAK5332533.1 hypothetical protein LTR98_011333 [Exophiala xenobiotica]